MRKPQHLTQRHKGAKSKRDQETVFTLYAFAPLRLCVGSDKNER